MNLRPGKLHSGNCHHRNLFLLGLLALAHPYVALCAPMRASLKQTFASSDAVVTGIRANVVEGDLSYQRAETKIRLEAGLELKKGDSLKSGSTARAELLLQPGNYLRIGENTELRVLEDQYDRLSFQIDKGVVSFELLGKESDRYNLVDSLLGQGYEIIKLVTPTAETFITQPGIFQIKVTGDEHTEVSVQKGQALINGWGVKEKRRATATGGAVTFTKADLKSEGSFGVWCRKRAERLIQANLLLKKTEPWLKAHKDGGDPLIKLPTFDREGVSPYLVSARQGVVTFAESGVELKSNNKSYWQSLTIQHELQAGDGVRTGPYSRVELMTLPDIYLRLDGASELKLEQLSSDALSLQLLRGSFILDIARFDPERLPRITIGGPSRSVTVVQAGNYRVDFKPNSEEITVREGAALFVGRVLAGCSRISVGPISKCDGKRSDNFDFWSQYRGEGTVYKPVRGAKGWTEAARLTLTRYHQLKHLGFWYRDAALGYYTFVPLYFKYFQSPYGGSYSTALSPGH